MTDPIMFLWNGEAMIPWPRFLPRCESFVVGKSYRLDVVRHRTRKSHNHFFACVNSAWSTLPEALATEFLSETKFRKWALVQAGYYKEMNFKAYSPEAALSFAVQCQGLDDYVEIIISGIEVTVRTAKSQAEDAMDGPEFQQCKDKVFSIMARLIGVDPAALQRNAGRAA